MELRAWNEGEVAAFFDIYSHWSVARRLGPAPRSAVATPDEAAARLGRWRDFHASLEPPYGTTTTFARRPPATGSA